MSQARRPGWRTLGVLGALAALIFLANAAWARLGTAAPDWDGAHHLTVGFAYARALSSGHFLEQLWQVPERYPPGHHLLLALGMLALGPSNLTPLVVNGFAVVLLLVATWRLGARTFGSRAGLIAAALVAFMPGMVDFSRRGMAECWVAALTVLTVGLLLDADESLPPLRAVLLGAAVGFGLLLKPTFAFYVWAPAMVVGLRTVRRRDWPRLRSLAASALVAGALAGLWYLPHWRDALALAADNRADALRWGHATGPLRAVSSRLSDLTCTIASGPCLLFLLAGLAWSVRHARAQSRLLHAALLGGWLIVVLVVVLKDGKYLLPAMPIWAVLAGGLSTYSGRRWLVTGATGLLCLFQAALVVVGLMPVEASACLRYLGTTRLCLASTEAVTVEPRARWPTLEISAAAQAHAAGPRARVAVIPDSKWLNINSLTWEARRSDSALEYQYVGTRSRELDPRPQDLRRFDLVVDKTGRHGEARNTELTAELSRFVRDNPQLFVEEARFELPDRSSALLYRVQGAALAPATAEAIEALTAQSDSRTRDLAFGDQYRLLGLQLQRTPRGATLRLAWESIGRHGLDASVCVHLTDDEGRIQYGSDYELDPRHGEAEPGQRWIDEVFLAEDALARASWIGVCVYRREDEGRLPVPGGLQPWRDARVAIPLRAVSPGP